jgi:hypothetical protein
MYYIFLIISNNININIGTLFTRLFKLIGTGVTEQGLHINWWIFDGVKWKVKCEKLKVKIADGLLFDSLLGSRFRFSVWVWPIVSSFGCVSRLVWDLGFGFCLVVLGKSPFCASTKSVGHGFKCLRKLTRYLNILKSFHHNICLG